MASTLGDEDEGDTVDEDEELPSSALHAPTADASTQPSRTPVAAMVRTGIEYAVLESAGQESKSTLTRSLTAKD